jgi:integrase
MRIGEIVRLRVEDVDLANNWLHVVSREGLETKSGHTWTVPIHPRLRKILEDVCRAKTGWFFTAKPSYKYPSGGHHINPRDANENFGKILATLGITAGREAGFTFHSFRSSFKTIAVNSGVPREVVDTWQDHQPDRAVSNLYYKLSDEESQRFMRSVQFGE